MSGALGYVSLTFLSCGIALLCGLLPKRPPRLDPRRLMSAPEVIGGVAGRFRARLPRRILAHEGEIYSALGIMRTMAAGSGESGILLRSDTLLEHLASACEALSGVFSECLALLRLGRSSEAVERFVKVSRAEYAKDFMLLIVSWDDTEPERLLSAVTSFREALKEKRMTKLRRKAEMMSDLIYLPVIVGALIVFINFVFVAYYAEQQALLAEMFY